MKLLQAVDRLEARRRNMPPKGAAIGIVWSADEREPLPGEVCDILQCDEDFGGVDRWIFRPRPARSVHDLGDVFNESGTLIGRVTAIDGSLVSVESVEASSTVQTGAASTTNRGAPGRKAKRAPAE